MWGQHLILAKSTTGHVSSCVKWYIWITSNMFSEVTSSTHLVRSYIYHRLRNIIPTILSKSYKQCKRWWETPAKTGWHKVSVIKQASDTYWWLPKKEMLLTICSENFDGVEPQDRPSERRYKNGCTTLLLTFTSPGYPNSLYFYFDTPPLQQF